MIFQFLTRDWFFTQGSDRKSFLIYLNCVKCNINPFYVGEALWGWWPYPQMSVPITCFLQGETPSGSPVLFKNPNPRHYKFWFIRGVADIYTLRIGFLLSFLTLGDFSLCKLSYTFLNKHYIFTIIGFLQWKLVLFVFNFFSLHSHITVNRK